MSAEETSNISTTKQEEGENSGPHAPFPSVREILWGPEGHRHVCVSCNRSCLASDALENSWEPCPVCRVIWCCSPACLKSHQKQDSYQCSHCGNWWTSLEAKRERQRRRGRPADSDRILDDIVGKAAYKYRRVEEEWSFQTKPRVTPSILVALEFEIERMRLRLSSEGTNLEEELTSAQGEAGDIMATFLAMGKPDRALGLFYALFGKDQDDIFRIAQLSSPGEWIFSTRDVYDSVDEVPFESDDEDDDGVAQLVEPFLMVLLIKLQLLAGWKLDKEHCQLLLDSPRASLHVVPEEVINGVIKSFLEPKESLIEQQRNDVTILIRQIRDWNGRIYVRDLLVQSSHLNQHGVLRPGMNVPDRLRGQNCWKVLLDGFARTPGVLDMLTEFVVQLVPYNL